MTAKAILLKRIIKETIDKYISKLQAMTNNGMTIDYDELMLFSIDMSLYLDKLLANNEQLKDDKFQVIFNSKTKMVEVLLKTNKEVQAELKDYIEELNAIN